MGSPLRGEPVRIRHSRGRGGAPPSRPWQEPSGTLDPAFLDQGDDGRTAGRQGPFQVGLDLVLLHLTDDPAGSRPGAGPDHRRGDQCGGKINPTTAPPTAPSAAPTPTLCTLSLTWILPSSSRLTRTSASTVSTLSLTSCLIASQPAWPPARRRTPRYTGQPVRRPWPCCLLERVGSPQTLEPNTRRHEGVPDEGAHVEHGVGDDQSTHPPPAE